MSTLTRRAAAACATLALATTGSLAVTGSSQAAAPSDDARLRQAVTVDGITAHQAKLEEIANANLFNGVPTRATGTPGHEASVQYVMDTMKAAGFKVALQPFTTSIFLEKTPAVFQRISPDPVTYEPADSETPEFATADFSGNGDVTAEAVAVDFTEPTSTPSASSSGCEASDFTPAVSGKIALLQRGTCDFGLKVENAQAAGAVGAVIFNEGTIGAPDRNDLLSPTLQGYHVTIPTVGTSYATGRHLVDLAAAGPVSLRIRVDGLVNNARTNNVIASTTTGRPDRTVVVGAHLDSVYAGPGINDDGSGTSLLLETAKQMKALSLQPHNRLRFIFFSGEEEGLVGSNYYVSRLSPKELSQISVMLDYDMLASGNYARFVYDGDGSDFGVAGPPGSGTVEQVFRHWYRKQGLAFETIPFDGRSDYDGFTTAGVPAGGIFAGAEQIKTPEQVALYGGTAGVAFDPCYHQACDVLANISRQGLQEHKDAALHAIWTFASRTTPVRRAAPAPATAAKLAPTSSGMKGHANSR